MSPRPAPAAHVGIFDSGVGGISILRSLRRRLPSVRVTYLADNRHLPYGDKPPAWLIERALGLTEQLLARNATLVLVACNTATTHTIAALREHWPDVPFVGVEPGIKPAVTSSPTKRIAVMATAATLASERMAALTRQHATDATVLQLPCPGLADAIDGGDDATIDNLLAQACDTLRKAHVDTVVLGCTHYPLIADRLAAWLDPAVQLIDTADAVCRRVTSLLSPVPEAGRCGSLELLATGDVASVTRAARRWIAPDVIARKCCA